MSGAWAWATQATIITNNDEDDTGIRLEVPIPGYRYSKAVEHVLTCIYRGMQ